MTPAYTGLPCKVRVFWRFLRRGFTSPERSREPRNDLRKFAEKRSSKNRPRESAGPPRSSAATLPPPLPRSPAPPLPRSPAPPLPRSHPSERDAIMRNGGAYRRAHYVSLAVTLSLIPVQRTRKLVVYTTGSAGRPADSIQLIPINGSI